MVDKEIKKKSRIGTIIFYIVAYLVISAIVGFAIGFIFAIFYPKINIDYLRAITFFLTFFILYSYFRIP